MPKISDTEKAPSRFLARKIFQRDRKPPKNSQKMSQGPEVSKFPARRTRSYQEKKEEKNLTVSAIDAHTTC